MKKTKFKIGDKVILISKKEPKHGWGSASTGDVGIIKRIHEYMDNTFYIDFPHHEEWMGISSEIVLLTKKLAPKKLLGFEVKKTPEGIKVGCKEISKSKLKQINGIIEYFNEKDSRFNFTISHDGRTTNPLTNLEIKALLEL